MNAACGAASERTLAQRERILCAAQQVFARHGFHAASMAKIASTAGMSAGLIYRYFENKNAIIQAIIARQLEEGARVIASLSSPEDVAEALLRTLEGWTCGDQPGMHAAQFLDITAAAARDPEIAGMVREASAQFGRQLTEVLRRHAARQGITLDETELEARTALLQCLIAGLAAQAIRDPSIDRTVLYKPLRQFVDKLMGA